MKKVFLTLTAATFLFAACNNSSETTNTEATEQTAPAEEEDSNVAEVELNAGDDMKYDVTEITVKEGQTVKLTLNHTGTAPVVAMGHNFVLLKQGTDLAKFAEAAMSAQATDYIPEAQAGDVIAHTTTIGGGESTEVEFAAPAKGTYEFLCSFPGHSAIMKGHFIVE